MQDWRGRGGRGGSYEDRTKIGKGESKRRGREEKEKENRRKVMFWNVAGLGTKNKNFWEDLNRMGRGNFVRNMD